MWSTDVVSTNVLYLMQEFHELQVMAWWFDHLEAIGMDGAYDM